MWCQADQEACTRTRGGAAWIKLSTRSGVEQIKLSNPMWCRADKEACTRTRGGATWIKLSTDVVSSGSSKVKPENPKEMESVAEKVVDKIETVEENDERITNEKFSEHIGRRGMVLRSVLMSSPRRSSKTLNPGDRCIFKTRKSMTEHTCVRSRSQSFRRKSPRPKQKIGHITIVIGHVTRSRARTSLCYKAFIS